MIARSTEHLEFDPVSSRERVVAGVLSFVFLFVVALDVPYATAQWQRVAWVAPTVQVVAFCALALTAWMLVAQYRVSRYAPLAILGCAFALAAAFRVAMFVCDPTTLTFAPLPFASVESSSYLRVFSRLAFDLIVMVYVFTDWQEVRHPGSAHARVLPVWIAAAAMLVLGTLVGTAGRATLPALFEPAGHFSQLYERIVAPLMFVGSAIAAALVLAAVNRRSRLRLWLFVDLVAMCADTISRAVGATTYSNGFYLSTGFEIVETTLFVFVVQAQIEETLRRAERRSARAYALSDTLALADAQSYNGIDALLARVRQELEFDCAGLFRVTGEEIEIESWAGTASYKRGQRFALEGSVAEVAIASREMVVVEDFREAQWAGIVHPGLWGSACLLPLFTEDGTYGTVAFANRHERHKRLTSLDREYLRVVGVMVGNALERIRQKRRLDELAYYDALTGLPNRVLLIDRITAAIAMAERNGQKLAVHFLDLDDFKPVNDRFGHAVGDDVLRGVALCLEHTVRASDTVARYGGDEFVVLQPVIEDGDGVADLQARIAQAMREPVVVAAGSFECSASMGVSIFPDDGRDAFSLVLRADEAQYRVKDARRAARANLPYDAV